MEPRRVAAVREATEADLPLVREIITHPSIWRFVGDDASPPPDEYWPMQGPTYLLVNEAEGVFIFRRQNAIQYDIHACLLPVSRGPKAIEAARAAMAWMFANTPCRKVNARVPTFNRHAYRLARKAGMQDEGTDRASFLKGGVAYDQHALGITCEELSNG